MRAASLLNLWEVPCVWRTSLARYSVQAKVSATHTWPSWCSPRRWVAHIGIGGESGKAQEGRMWVWGGEGGRWWLVLGEYRMAAEWLLAGGQLGHSGLLCESRATPIVSTHLDDFSGRKGIRSLTHFQLRPKPAFFTIARALAPISLGARRTVTKNREHDRPRAFYEYGAFQSRDVHFEAYASNAGPQLNAKCHISAVDLSSDWREDRVLNVSLGENRSTELWAGPCPAPPKDKAADKAAPSGTVVLQLRLEVGGRVVARYSDWPQPYRTLEVPDPGVRLVLAGDTVEVSAMKPAKGVWLSVEGDDDGVVWSDNSVGHLCSSHLVQERWRVKGARWFAQLDVFPGDTQAVTVSGLRGRTITVARLGHERPVVVAGGTGGTAWCICWVLKHSRPSATRPRALAHLPLSTLTQRSKHVVHPVTPPPRPADHCHLSRAPPSRRRVASSPVRALRNPHPRWLAACRIAVLCGAGGWEWDVASRYRRRTHHVHPLGESLVLHPAPRRTGSTLSTDWSVLPHHPTDAEGPSRPRRDALRAPPGLVVHPPIGSMPHHRSLTARADLIDGGTHQVPPSANWVRRPLEPSPRLPFPVHTPPPITYRARRANPQTPAGPPSSPRPLWPALGASSRKIILAEILDPARGTRLLRDLAIRASGR